MKYYKLFKEFWGTIAMFGIITAFVAVPAFSLAQVYTTANGQTVSPLTGQLDFGARGTDVTNLQLFLGSNPSWYPQDLVTGYFGVLTQAAVTRYQIAVGLPGVGRVGPLTLARINAAITGGSVSYTTITPFTAPTIYSVNVSTYSSSSSLPLSGTAVVGWLTNTGTTGKVFYSSSLIAETEAQAVRTEPGISGSVVMDTNLSTSHSLTLTGLSSGTIYYYVIESIDANGNVSVTNPNVFTAQ